MTDEDTGDRIVRAMLEHRFRGLGVSEIAAAAEIAPSTVRRWLPRLRERRLVRECGHYGWWTTTSEARAGQK